MREKVRADTLARFMKSIGRGLIEPSHLLELFSQVEDKLYKYPAIDANSLRRAVEQLAQEQE